MNTPPAAICVVTGNKGKLKEIEAITGYRVEPVSLEIDEIQSLNVEVVARAKAAAAYSRLKRPVIVDDTGMTIHALNGMPGALVAWFLDCIGPEGMLRLLSDSDDRRATVVTCIAYADENGVQSFTGSIDGTISTTIRGTNGFGYDPIFVPDGHQGTYAEMTNEDKNQISMRRLALENMKRSLKF